LGGLHGVDAAPASFQHDAFVIPFFDERKSHPIGPQAGEAGNELVLRHSKKFCDRSDLLFFDPHIARPFTAGCASLADVVHTRL